ncbi:MULTISPECIES: ABC transporter substrate-binding protein [unclassified Halanaerobium]|uniref:ABC transporter substrate-binding protein n=1 Tax=unclassified Halanaerobium TaxID=2641197 RepID=UPI000DF3D2BB|nr:MULTISPECIES: ABC transporter substrate-binding protein [unclassified Halanaerobium]RCW48299.1 extracellular solute-binding protein (family 5) [Halanaerobium sp. MA284_MarDTE_T2]RCW85726.1 extracellular solute-binding protein (family 5) [Halanaerobium sp. DL-01]
MRRKFNYLVVCSIIGVLLLMSFSTSVLAEEKEVVAQGVDATTMIPCMESITSTSNILENMYDTLVWRDEDLNLIPALATDWENVDELTWDFYLRDDVYWHDGEKFTAHKVYCT